MTEDRLWQVVEAAQPPVETSMSAADYRALLDLLGRARTTADWISLTGLASPHR